MIKLLTLVFVICLWSTYSFGQIACDSIYTTVDEMPNYGKGNRDIINYLSTTLKFNKENCRPEEVKRLIWTINKEGNVTDIDVVGVGATCKTRIIEQLKEFPKWTPGRHKGELVCVRMIFPIHIRPDY